MQLQIHAWSQRLARRANNSSHVDNMMGRVMGVSNEDELGRPGAMGEFYRDVDLCACCYKVYRQLDKRRSKMREAARKHKSIHPQALKTDDEGGVMGAGGEGVLGGAQLHGRNLKQEVWEALGYGRVSRKASQEVVMKQKGVVEKLSQVPQHRDLSF